MKDETSFFSLYLVGRMPVPILNTTMLFAARKDARNTSSVKESVLLSDEFLLLDGFGLEHSGKSWVSLNEGSRFARALRSWDGIDGNSFTSFGVTGAEWERVPSRTATVWTQEIAQDLSMVEFQVQRHQFNTTPKCTT